jgi:hypothetical protein
MFNRQQPALRFIALPNHASHISNHPHVVRKSYPHARHLQRISRIISRRPARPLRPRGLSGMGKPDGVAIGRTPIGGGRDANGLSGPSDPRSSNGVAPKSKTRVGTSILRPHPGALRRQIVLSILQRPSSRNAQGGGTYKGRSVLIKQSFIRPLVNGTSESRASAPGAARR